MTQAEFMKVLNFLQMYNLITVQEYTDLLNRALPFLK